MASLLSMMAASMSKIARTHVNEEFGGFSMCNLQLIIAIYSCNNQFLVIGQTNSAYDYLKVI